KYPNKAVRVSFDQELKKLDLNKKDLYNLKSGRNFYFNRYDYMFYVKGSKYKYTFVYWYRMKESELYYDNDQGGITYTKKIRYGE
ncbi:hypothetical protein A5884_001258, partial [Enterococcus sp. 7D2_DIV0200]|uniref:hypothetical protein n=1 Tax=Enterococcus sp. 7D2_DIV0200 TaxID=1834187 RepID=UPI000B7469E4